jgi:thiamine-monophosphate kinase
MTARAGDVVVVSGTIGDAAVGLRLRRDPSVVREWGLDPTLAPQLLDRYRLPQPRNAIAEAIRTHARAAMDISDGLVGDLGKMCKASGVAAVIEAARVPLSDGARAALAAAPALLEPILTGGDDYEILATVGEAQLFQLQAAAHAAGVPLTAIGRIGEGEGVRVIGADGKDLAFEQGSYSHF